MPCHRTYDQRIPGVGDAAQRGDRGEIDKIGRLGEAKLQSRDESHPAGDDFGFFVGAKQTCNLIKARRLVIVEFVHWGSPYSAASGVRCCWIVRQSFSGVAGMSRCRTPSGFSASTSALVIAAGAPIAPASPHPSLPAGCACTRWCWWTV